MARNNEPDLLDDDVEEMREGLERSAAEIEKLRKALIQERDKNARLREQLGMAEETRRGAVTSNEATTRHRLLGPVAPCVALSEFPAVCVRAAVFGNAAYGPKFLSDSWLAFVPDMRRKWRNTGNGANRSVHRSLSAVEPRAIPQARAGSTAPEMGRVLRCLWRSVSWCAASWPGRAATGGQSRRACRRDGPDLHQNQRMAGRQIRVHVWQTRPVAIVKGWF